MLKEPPDLPLVEERVRANLTSIYLQGKDHKRASEQLEAIMRDDPTNPAGLLLPGPVGAGGQETGGGRRPFQQDGAAEPGPRIRPITTWRWRKSSLNQTSEALATLEKARQKFAQSFALEFYTALAYSRQKDYAEALQHFVAAEVIAKATDPSQLNEGFYFQLGAACERKGDYAQAEKYFEKCLQLAPDFAEAHELPRLHVGGARDEAASRRGN